jgi:hypothetical protein
VASLVLILCQQFLVRPVQAQAQKVPQPPNPLAVGVVVVIDAPARVNGGPATVNRADFKIQYTIFNNTPDVVEGTLTAVFNGTALTPPGGPATVGPEPLVVSTKISNIAKGGHLTNSFEALIPGTGTFSASLFFCGNSYPVKSEVTLAQPQPPLGGRPGFPGKTVTIITYVCKYRAHDALDIVATVVP